MLKHQDNTELPPQPAANVRVTSEELVAALASLQIHKEGQSGTIAIGDAVEELSLEAAPADILREVVLRRESLQQCRMAARRKRKWVISACLGLFCLGGLGIYSVTGSEINVSSQMIPGKEPYVLEPKIIALNSPKSKPVVSTLAEAPEGKTIFCSPEAIEILAMCRHWQMGPEREIYSSATNLNWPVVKHGKEIYIRGWIQVPFSKAASKLTEVDVYNRPSLPQLGSHPQQITLKLDQRTSMVGLGYQRLCPDGTGVFTFQNPLLTPHAYEKW